LAAWNAADEVRGGAGGEVGVGEGGVVQQRALKEQVGGGARRFATDAFRKGEAGAAVEVGRGVCGRCGVGRSAKGSGVVPGSG